MQSPLFSLFSGKCHFFFRSDDMHPNQGSAVTQKFLHFFSGDAETHTGDTARNFHAFSSDNIFFSFHGLIIYERDEFERVEKMIAWWKVSVPVLQFDPFSKINGFSLKSIKSSKKIFMFELVNANIRNNLSFVKVPIEKKLKKKSKSLNMAQFRQKYFLN